MKSLVLRPNLHSSTSTWFAEQARGGGCVVRHVHKLKREARLSMWRLTLAVLVKLAKLLQFSACCPNSLQVNNYISVRRATWSRQSDMLTAILCVPERVRQNHKKAFELGRLRTLVASGGVLITCAVGAVAHLSRITWSLTGPRKLQRLERQVRAHFLTRVSAAEARALVGLLWIVVPTLTTANSRKVSSQLDLWGCPSGE
eukprot:1225537-Amphidinium_carterae.1